MKELAGDLPFGQDKNAVGDGEHLRKLRRNKEHSETLLGQPIHDLKNLSLRTHIDTTCRLIQKQDLRLRKQALGKNHFLLIAATQ